MKSESRYVLVRPDLLRLLMERTYTGASISGRELAAAVGVPPSTINALLTGTTRSQPQWVVDAICHEVGIGPLCLWAPKARAARAAKPQPSQMAVA
ncbi:helix-turn-helix domain-containing protein [Streptomyces sp. bgisy031]|uniref:helix-turn-helix domain-containing protein n=1 Tax=Streptomyces sp. bgisy031 TaxID=3413772 RepID=UPI003D745E80